MTHPSQEAQDSITLLNLLADIRAACGDNGKRMQDELVEHIRAGFAELALLRSQQACAQAFPERIMSVLKQVADRNPGGSLLPWEDGQGEPLQDDADAAIAWIASRSQQPVSGGERERFEAWMIDRGFEPFDLRRGHSGDYIDLETDGRWQAWQAARLSAPQAVGWLPMNSAPLDGTRVRLNIRHANWWAAKKVSDVEAEHWEANVEAEWIDFNGGGWTWNGMAGMPVGWQPLPAPPTQQGE